MAGHAWLGHTWDGNLVWYRRGGLPFYPKAIPVIFKVYADGENAVQNPSPPRLLCMDRRTVMRNVRKRVDSMLESFRLGRDDIVDRMCARNRGSCYAIKISSVSSSDIINATVVTTR